MKRFDIYTAVALVAWLLFGMLALFFYGFAPEFVCHHDGYPHPCEKAASCVAPPLGKPVPAPCCFNYDTCCDVPNTNQCFQVEASSDPKTYRTLIYIFIGVSGFGLVALLLLCATRSLFVRENKPVLVAPLRGRRAGNSRPAP